IAFAIIPSSGFAQHILACKGTDQVPIGSSTVFQMEDGKVYPIIGISVNGSLMFATPLGAADYHGDHLRVVDGGQYVNADVTLERGVLTNTGTTAVTQCYAALQTYQDGRPNKVSVQIIGTPLPGRPVPVNLSAQGGGTTSFHLWSGENE